MRLKKRLGQYILTDQNAVQQIIEVLEVKPEDTVLEIGPGTGVLTNQLVQKTGFVLAIEKDYRMVESLRAKFKVQSKKLKVIHEDILGFDENTIEGPYKLVGNLPYNITSPILRKFLESSHLPTVMVVMMQKEVAQRVTAPPGDSNRGILTLMVEYFSNAEILFEVPRTAFIPHPNVDSAVVKLVPKPLLLTTNYLLLFRVIKAGFSTKRRQIHNSLAGGLALSSQEIHVMLKTAGIDATKRAEDLTLEQWQNLSQVWSKRFLKP